MSLSKKLVTTLILAPALFLSVAQGQTKKYEAFLRTDTLGSKQSINLPLAKSRLDSLLHLKKSSGDGDLFLTKNIVKQKFIVDYDNYILHDKLDEAKQLIEDHLKTDFGKKESIFGERKLYLKYQKDLEQRYVDQDNNLFVLLEKKRKFKKKFKEIIKTPSLESYTDGRDLAVRCSKYAKRNNLVKPSYVDEYGRYATAKIIDESTDFDLEKAKKNKRNLEKILKPYFESEDMAEYLKAANFLDTLTIYSKMSPYGKLTSRELKNKKYELAKLIQKEQEFLDYDSLAKEGNKFGVAQFSNDSLNPEGIFLFNDRIVVIINFYSQYSNSRFIQGNGVETADKFLVRYADENDSKDKHSEANETIKGGNVIPYFIDGEKLPFLSTFNTYQIRVSYQMVRGKFFTNKIKNTLRPIDIDTNYYGLVNEFYDAGGEIKFYRNKEGSFVHINYADSAVIISEYDDCKGRNTNDQDHFIDKVQVFDLRKRRHPEIKTYKFNSRNGIPEEQQPIFERYSSLFRKYYNSSKRFF